MAAGVSSARGEYAAGSTVSSHIGSSLALKPDRTRRDGMTRRIPPRKVTYFEPIAPRLARNTVIESTFEVGRRFRCTVPLPVLADGPNRSAFPDRVKRFPDQRI